MGGFPGTSTRADALASLLVAHLDVARLNVVEKCFRDSCQGLADRLEQTEPALRDYRFVSQVWADADPELQPIVEEAEEAVSRLGS